MIKGFIKNKEDFTCENCGALVIGDGYTNHCPQCLYSKHVDVAPGDRLAPCGGLMKPTAVSGSTNHVVITHTCQICGFVRNNKLQKEDSVDALVQVVEKLNSQK
jgi:rubrerythrin